MGAVAKIKQALQSAGLDLSLSDGTIEAKIVDVVGTYADSEAIERTNTLDQINNALANQKVTTKGYYRTKAVEYQAGDNLEYDSVNGGGYYATIDPQKRIVKQAYIAGEFPLYVMFVNKIGSDNHLTPLTANELAAFRSYFDAFQPIGMTLSVVSFDAAKITASKPVIYIEAGYDASTIAADINTAFTDNEQVLRKTNLVTVSEIADIVQSVSGVKAVSFGTLLATETRIDGSVHSIYPTDGVFELTAGAFTFGTEITPEMIKTIG